MNKRAKKKAAKKAPKKTKSFEKSLWDSHARSEGRLGKEELSPLLHSSFSLLTSLAKGEGEIRQKLVKNDLVDCVENQAYLLAA